MGVKDIYVSCGCIPRQSNTNLDILEVTISDTDKVSIVYTCNVCGETKKVSTRVPFEVIDKEGVSVNYSSSINIPPKVKSWKK